MIYSLEVAAILHRGRGVSLLGALWRGPLLHAALTDRWKRGVGGRARGMGCALLTGAALRDSEDPIPHDASLPAGVEAEALKGEVAEKIPETCVHVEKDGRGLQESTLFRRGGRIEDPEGCHALSTVNEGRNFMHGYKDYVLQLIYGIQVRPIPGERVLTSCQGNRCAFGAHSSITEGQMCKMSNDLVSQAHPSQMAVFVVLERSDSEYFQLSSLAEEVTGGNSQKTTCNSRYSRRVAASNIGPYSGTCELLRPFRWDVLNHPPYSPDLATSDFLIFSPLKAQSFPLVYPFGYAFEAEKWWIYKDDSATCIKCNIVAMSKVLTWHARFPSCCLYLWDFKRVFTVTSQFPEALPKFYVQDIPLPHANKAEPRIDNFTKGAAHWIHVQMQHSLHVKPLSERHPAGDNCRMTRGSLPLRKKSTQPSFKQYILAHKCPRPHASIQSNRTAQHSTAQQLDELAVTQSGADRSPCVSTATLSALRPTTVEACVVEYGAVWGPGTNLGSLDRTLPATCDTSSRVARRIIVLEYPIHLSKDNHHVRVDVIVVEGRIVKLIKSAFHTDDGT
ncbi:hypothetical protein PR048_002519 [Dryococelus australis]|uniref:Uncharacterized protein n=1 Tax=Dryococelus australis TaxID=614101 RepID=A0ABQ9IMU5_9NEOP|nr:hypothetical protein PR048_002519 [Dryococelus australis]